MRLVVRGVRIRSSRAGHASQQQRMPNAGYGQGYLLVDLGEGAGPEHQFMLALTLIELCIRFWRDFFHKHRLDVKLKHTENHAI